jgi:hypothetical protein
VVLEIATTVCREAGFEARYLLSRQPGADTLTEVQGRRTVKNIGTLVSDVKTSPEEDLGDEALV